MTILLTIVILSFLLCLLYTRLYPKKKYSLSIASVDFNIHSDELSKLDDAAREYVGLKNTEDVYIDDSFHVALSSDVGEVSNMTYNQRKLNTYLAAKKIDIIIATEGAFEYYIANDYFDNLDEFLPTDLFASLSDKFYFGTSNENSNRKPHGILLNNLVNCDNNPPDDRIVMGIVSNSENKNNCISFIRFLLEYINR